MFHFFFPTSFLPVEKYMQNHKLTELAFTKINIPANILVAAPKAIVIWNPLDRGYISFFQPFCATPSSEAL
jgi:hypothetical protein